MERVGDDKAGPPNPGGRAPFSTATRRDGVDAPEVICEAGSELKSECEPGVLPTVPAVLSADPNADSTGDANPERNGDEELVVVPESDGGEAVPERGC